MSDAAHANPRTVRLALVLLFMATFAVAISGTMVRLSETGPTATAFWRMALAIPAMWLMMGLERRGSASPITARTLSIHDYLFLAAAGICFGIEIAIWNAAMMMTSVANGTLLSNLSPLFVALGAHFILGQRFSRTFHVGLILSLAGAGVLMGEDLSISARHLAGDTLALSAAAFFGAYILIIAKLRSRLRTSVIMLWTCVFAALPILPLPFILGEPFWPYSLGGWAVLLAVALICQAGGQSLLTYALAHLPAAFSSIGFLLVPVNAAIVAWIVLGEPVRPLQAVGAAIILAGIVVARRGSR
ncbi:MAG: DMT family transporter [Alphaproteobacteria bacterium]